MDCCHNFRSVLVQPPPPPPDVLETFPVAKSICESSLRTSTNAAFFLLLTDSMQFQGLLVMLINYYLLTEFAFQW